MKCLNCQTLNPDIVIYCQNCGTYLNTGSQNDYTDAFKALLLSLIFTSIFYLVFPIPATDNEYIQQLFTGHVSESITWLTLWSVFIILFKFHRHRKQIKAYHAFRHQSVHQVISRGILVKEVQQKLDEVSQLLQQQGISHFQESLIFCRIRRVLHYIRTVPKKEESHTIMNYQAEIDYNHLENGYTLLNVFIWAIPILGFIGTVFGIGEAIGEFSEFIRSVNTVNLGGQMRSALGGVTSGLSIAFNTTFLALICVIPIMVITSFLRKAEEDLLLLVEEYCLEELLPQIHIHPGEDQPTGGLDNHLYQLMQFSENWMSQIAPLFNSMTRYAENLKAQIEGLQPLVRDFSNSFFQVKDTITTETESPSSDTADTESYRAVSEVDLQQVEPGTHHKAEALPVATPLAQSIDIQEVILSTEMPENPFPVEVSTDSPAPKNEA
ncbi:MotA/TolQ/ExbB proton channel family protein [Deltaproteobacteria bacterium TL4]